MTSASIIILFVGGLSKSKRHRRVLAN